MIPSTASRKIINTLYASLISFSFSLSRIHICLHLYLCLTLQHPVRLSSLSLVSFLLFIMAPNVQLSADFHLRVKINLNTSLPKHTGSEISRLEHICTCFYPILRIILQYLSGSDAAVLLSVIGLFQNPGWQGITKKSVTLLRDIPEHVDWISQMVSKGHAAFLIGGDLEIWRSRQKYPLTHGTRSPLRLWLAVRVSRELRDERRRRQEVRPNAYFLVSKDGDVVWGPSREAYNLSKSGVTYSKTTIIPPPGNAENLPYLENGRTSWMKTCVPNENGIEIV